jgi:hypothetical protein
MKDTSKNLVNSLKQEGQDFEFYPTTKEILKPIVKDLLFESYISLLDVGAGNGGVFKIIEELTPIDTDGKKKLGLKKYAIEKSLILLKSLPDDVFVIGTDFEEQTFIDKKIDIIFCNPPYKQYVRWMEKIIKEANSKCLYFVVPERWKKEEIVLKAIKARLGKDKIDYKILGSFDFIDSEFRSSRAKIDIVKISLEDERYSRGNLVTDPFDVWFNEFFKINADIEKPHQYEENKSKAEQIHSLANGQNLIEVLADAYSVDLKNLIATYKVIETLDPILLKELNVNLSGIKEGLKVKISGLKNLYWQELFNNLDKLTSRLTSTSRKNMLETLTAHTHIDFTSNNAYSVVIWAIKNVNKYLDQQLCEVYKTLSEPDSIKNYKSNQRILKDDWRYLKHNNQVSHYVLDYRIVSVHYQCFNLSSYGNYDYPNGLHKDCHDFLNDICAIAKNLGFDVIDKTKAFQWTPGETNDFYLSKKGGEPEIFMSVKAYKNGNIHLKINQEFMKAFNIEAARINKWVKTPESYAEETGEKINDVKQYYSANLQFNLDNVKRLVCL